MLHPSYSDLMKVVNQGKIKILSEEDDQQL